jgi:hypothetical protein
MQLAAVMPQVSGWPQQPLAALGQRSETTFDLADARLPTVEAVESLVVGRLSSVIPSGQTPLTIG